MSSNTNKLLTIMTMFLIVGCKGQLQSDDSVNAKSQDSESYSVDLVLESLDRAGDDFSAELNDETEILPTDVAIENLEEIDFETEIDKEERDPIDARFFRCKRPARRRTCRSNGEESAKLAYYNNCILPGTRVLALGHVKLEYNNASCSLTQAENLVQRTYRLSLNRIQGGVANFFSSESSNYLGESFGGGEVLEKTPHGWELTILGRHINSLHTNGQRRASVSIQTTEPIVISGSLNKRRRTIVSGTTSVHHNLARFTATYSADHLVWTADCACPVSGTMNVQYTGTITAAGNVTFQGCGQANLQKRSGLVQTLALRQCFIQD